MLGLDDDLVVLGLLVFVLGRVEGRVAFDLVVLGLVDRVVLGFVLGLVEGRLELVLGRVEGLVLGLVDRVVLGLVLGLVEGRVELVVLGLVEDPFLVPTVDLVEVPPLFNPVLVPDPALLFLTEDLVGAEPVTAPFLGP